MVEIKKYYSISEVAENLQISSHQLRYLELKITELVIFRVKNRRYYTVNDITNLRQHLTKANRPAAKIDLCQKLYQKSIELKPSRIVPTLLTIPKTIDIEKIDLLISNFQELAKKIRSFSYI